MNYKINKYEVYLMIPTRETPRTYDDSTQSFQPIGTRVFDINIHPQLCFVPDDIWVKILSYIDSMQDKSSLSLTQRCVYRIFRNPLIWNPLLEKHFPDLLLGSSNLKGLDLYKICTEVKRKMILTEVKSKILKGKPKSDSISNT